MPRFGQPDTPLPAVRRALRGWVLAPALGVDGVALRVSLHYFSGVYTADVLAIGPNSLVVRFRGAAGQPYVQRVEITPTARRLAANTQHRARLTARSADAVTRFLTGFDTFGEMLRAPGGYRPTILQDGLYALLAESYDAAQRERKDARRAYRRPGTPGMIGKVRALRARVA